MMLYVIFSEREAQYKLPRLILEGETLGISFWSVEMQIVRHLIKGHDTKVILNDHTLFVKMFGGELK